MGSSLRLIVVRLVRNLQSRIWNRQCPSGAAPGVVLAKEAERGGAAAPSQSYRFLRKSQKPLCEHGTTLKRPMLRFVFQGFAFLVCSHLNEIRLLRQPVLEKQSGL